MLAIIVTLFSVLIIAISFYVFECFLTFLMILNEVFNLLYHSSETDYRGITDSMRFRELWFLNHSSKDDFVEKRKYDN